MAYSTPRTWAAGERPTAAQFNQDIRDNVLFLANPPACRVYNSANISIPNNAVTALTFNSKRYDTDGMHSTSSNTGRITINTAGLYLVSFVGHFDTNGTGVRGVFLRLGGSTQIASDWTPTITATGVEASIPLSTVYKFAAAEWVDVAVYQNSGGALNIMAAGNRSPEFTATWIGLG